MQGVPQLNFGLTQAPQGFPSGLLPNATAPSAGLLSAGFPPLSGHASLPCLSGLPSLLQQGQPGAPQLGVLGAPGFPPGLPTGLPGGLPPPNDLQALIEEQQKQLQQQQQQLAETQRSAAAAAAAAAAAGAGRGGDKGRLPLTNPGLEAAAKQAAEASARSAREAREKKLKEQEAEREQVEKVRCHLHSKKPQKNCKFCKRYQEFLKGKEEEKESAAGKLADKGSRMDDIDRRGPLEWVNAKNYGFSPLLQTHVVESAHFKALVTLETFEQLVEEMYQYADNIEPYMANSSTTPSAMFCCLYRMFMLSIDGRQLHRLIDAVDNGYVRCIGFLCIRFGLPPEQLWTWLGEYVLDDEELHPSKDSEWVTTIGDFVEGLLIQEKYYTTVLPRLPMSVKRQLEVKLATVPQYRKRTRANLDLLDVYRTEGVKVEANINGDWIPGSVIELMEEIPSRIKVRVEMEDNSEEVVHIGKVILVDHRYENYGKQGSKSGGTAAGGRARSRSRSAGRTDWAREKGKSEKELLDELRSKDRDKAVCTSGKEYARKPIGYKAACALPREQGAASHRLMEEETFVPMKQTRRRSPSPSNKEQAFRQAPSAEHQARMKQLFEKYGVQKSDQAANAKADVDQPDVMRLG